MKLGIWTPLPHTHRAEPAMDDVIVELSTRGGPQSPDKSLALALDTVQRAERYGFDITLVAERHLGPDLEAWCLSSALIALTERIEILTAVHPGVVAPQLAAKMGATLDRMSGGRFAVNVVNGSWPDEFALFGNGATLGTDGSRYRRMKEFMQVLKAMWTEDEFSYPGEFYTVQNGTLPTKVRRLPHPPIYAASRSEEGKEAVASECDVWFLTYPSDYRTFEDNHAHIAAEASDMAARSARYDRQVQCAISANVVCADTAEKAVEMAEEIEAFATRGRMEALSSQGLGAGLIGTPEMIAERIAHLEQAGISCVMLKFFPLVEQLDRFAEDVLPLLGRTQPNVQSLHRSA